MYIIIRVHRRTIIFLRTAYMYIMYSFDINIIMICIMQHYKKLNITIIYSCTYCIIL